MKFVAAPEEYEKTPGEVAVFMAGGMGNTDWHQEFLSKFDDLEGIVIYYPYNKHITSNYAQIEWEQKYIHKYLWDQFIFSIYFDKYTQQPMSMLELGQMLELQKDYYVNISIDNSINKAKLPIYPKVPMVVTLHPQCPNLSNILAICTQNNIDAQIGTGADHGNSVIKVYRDLIYMFK